MMMHTYAQGLVSPASFWLGGCIKVRGPRAHRSGLCLGGIALGGEVDLAVLVLVEEEHVSAEANGSEAEDPGEGLGGLGAAGAVEGGGIEQGEGVLDVVAAHVVGGPVVAGLLLEALLASGGELDHLLAELVDLDVLVVVVVVVVVVAVVVVGILVDLLARDGLVGADKRLSGVGEGAAVAVLGVGCEAVGGGDGAAAIHEHAEADLLAAIGAVGADEVVDVTIGVALELGALKVLLDLEVLLALVLDAVVLAGRRDALVVVVLLVVLAVVVVVVVVAVLVLVLLHLPLVLAGLAGDFALVLLISHLGLSPGVEEFVHGGDVRGAGAAAGGGAEGELDGVVGDEGTHVVSAALLAEGGGGVARGETDGVLPHPGVVALLLLLLVLVVLVELTDLGAADVLGIAHHALVGADGLGAAVDLAVGAAGGDGGGGEEEGSNGELHLGCRGGGFGFVKVELNEL